MDNEEAATASVIFRVSNARPVHARDLFALVDVEVLVGGVAFDIFGIQARREPGEKTSIRLPTFKDADGSWHCNGIIPIRCFRSSQRSHGQAEAGRGAAMP